VGGLEAGYGFLTYQAEPAISSHRDIVHRSLIEAKFDGTRMTRIWRMFADKAIEIRANPLHLRHPQC
jgi:hypothetical protein